MKPVIAMPKLSNDPFRIYMKSKYVLSLWRTGARVRWINPEDTEDNRNSLLQCDGLLMPCGVDIEPARYGQETDEKCGKIDLARDAAEWWMLEAFLPTGKPILGICRGCQFLNVYLGGTLHQHIEGHSDFRSRARGCHDVTVLPETVLSALLPESLRVNSLHHQAVDVLGKGLTVTARAEGGTVEAIELTGHPFFVAVQWHPEHLSHNRPDQRKLFDHFVSLCKR